jgi:hypothetical protein
MRHFGAIFGFFIVAAAIPAFAGAWVNSLQPAGQPAAAFTVIANGAPTCAIVLPAQPTAPQRKAASDLQHWLKELTGFRFVVAHEREPPPAGVSRFIRLSATNNLGDEGYEIAVSGEDLVLRGGPRGRGIVNAVYALLEEDIGCRWYTRDGQARLPTTKLTSIAAVPRTFTPKLKMRDPHYHAAFDAEWSLRNRTNAPNAVVPEEAGGRIDYGGLYVHTHAALLPADRYFKDHPEYFAQNVKGDRYSAQLCPTNPDVARIVTQNVLDILDKSPATEIISVSKNDNTGNQICHCSTCTKLRADEGGTDAANQLFLVNQVAEAVEARHPRVVIDTLAYIETLHVPRTIRPRSNVAVRLCSDVPGAWSWPFRTAANSDIATLTRAWSSVHDRLDIWDYAVNFSHYLAPMPNLDIIAANIRYWVANHAQGLMIQGGYQGISERDEMRVWIIAKLMWDPSRDLMALTADFVQGYYGKAAEPIAAYEVLLSELRARRSFDSVAGGIRYPMDAPFLTNEFVASATQLFMEATKLAADDKLLLRKVERAELPILYVKLSRGPAFTGVHDYGATLKRFERIARREGVAYLAEGSPDFETKVAAWRQQVPK